MTLRDAMSSREGSAEADRQIRRGLRAWAVERRDDTGRRPETTIVFGTCASDARRRASAPARLGEATAHDATRVLPIASGWDEPFVWPFDRGLA